jgi:hypothetical protein
MAQRPKFRSFPRDQPPAHERSFAPLDFDQLVGQ